MAYIRKLPSGKWQATVRHPSGKRLTVTDPLKKVVVDWAREQETAMARGEWRDPQAGRTTFREWRDRWWAARVVEDETRRGDQSVLRNHIDPAWSDWPLAAISRLEVQAWVRRLQQAGVGAPAIRRAHNLFRVVLAAAVDEDLIPANPCQRVQLPAAPPKPPAWFTLAEVERLLEHLPEPHRTMTLLMCWCGLRWGEAAGLRVDDVDWLRGRLRVEQVVTQSGTIKAYPKTSKSRREIPMPRHVLDELSKAAAGRDDLLFVTRRGERPLSGANWRKTWASALDAAGVQHETPHTCRHTAASWLVQAGVPLYDVQRLLGHDSITTTMRYAHLAPDAHRAVEDGWERLVTHQRRTDDTPAGQKGA